MAILSTISTQIGSAVRKLEHSINFYTSNTVYYNTYIHWHLIPVTVPVVAEPAPVYNYIDIPGRDGALDLSNYLIGRPTYGDRIGTFEFYVDHEQGSGNWASRRDEISAILNCEKIMKMQLVDEMVNGKKPYYKGRFHLKQWVPDPSYSKVIIEYRVEPMQYFQ